MTAASERRRQRQWTDMKPEDFDARLAPKPAPPGQDELFEIEPEARGAVRRGAPEPCGFGTIDLIDLLGSSEQ